MPEKQTESGQQEPSPSRSRLAARQPHPEHEKTGHPLGMTGFSIRTWGVSQPRHTVFHKHPSVREGGLEPPRPCGHWHLKPARLPIPPLAQITESEVSPRTARSIITGTVAGCLIGALHRCAGPQPPAPRRTAWNQNGHPERFHMGVIRHPSDLFLGGASSIGKARANRSAVPPRIAAVHSEHQRQREERRPWAW